MGGTVLYDGDCSFCSRQARFISDKDVGEGIQLVSMKSEEGRAMLKAAGMDDGDADTIVYRKDDRYLKRSDAVLHILRDMDGGWKLLYGFIIIPVFIRDFFYNMVARNRHRLTPARNHRH